MAYKPQIVNYTFSTFHKVDTRDDPDFDEPTGALCPKCLEDGFETEMIFNMQFMCPSQDECGYVYPNPGQRSDEERMLYFKLYEGLMKYREETNWKIELKRRKLTPNG